MTEVLLTEWLYECTIDSLSLILVSVSRLILLFIIVDLLKFTIKLIKANEIKTEIYTLLTRKRSGFDFETGINIEWQ